MTIGPVRIVEVEAQITAVVPVSSPMEELPHAQRAAHATLEAVIPELDLEPLGLSLTAWKPPSVGILYMEPGFIVPRAFEGEGGVVCSGTPAGRAAHLTLTGSFAGLSEAWSKLFQWCAENGHKTAGTNWEIYGAREESPTNKTELYALLD
jgi:GyrI-like small molecule binding domain